ncbi:MAG: RsmG family class I SAM-dependent methyltransferase, partial [Acidobacteriota bacterium]|nr:RsmG family class I SAM-dependent methyltransferase [Acidobacteriota bacterium]
MSEADGFAGFALEEAIRNEAASRAIDLGDASVEALARHARAVLASNARLHLTSIVVPQEFVSRHIGEAFEGAALLPGEIEGAMLDLGSGNGYPGLPVALARPGLSAILAESKEKKAAFLRDVAAGAGFGEVEVLERHVERASDVAELGTLAVLITRATGGW